MKHWIEWLTPRVMLAAAVYFIVYQADAGALRVALATLVILDVIGLALGITLLVNVDNTSYRGNDKYVLKWMFFDEYVIRPRPPWSLQILLDYSVVAFVAYHDVLPIAPPLCALALIAAAVRFLSERRAARFAAERMNI